MEIILGDLLKILNRVGPRLLKRGTKSKRFNIKYHG